MSWFDILAEQVRARRAAAEAPPPAPLPVPETPACRRKGYPITSDPPSKVPMPGGGPHSGVTLGCLPDPDGFCCYCGESLTPEGG